MKPLDFSSAPAACSTRQGDRCAHLRLRFFIVAAVLAAMVVPRVAAEVDPASAERDRLTAELLRELAAGEKTAAPVLTQAPPAWSGSPGADHRALRVREISGLPPIRSSGAGGALTGGLPVMPDGAPLLPDEWLLGPGQPWHYRTAAKPGRPPVPVRLPSPEEQRLIERAEGLLKRIPSRVVVLIDDGQIVEALSTGGIQWNTRLMSASMAKTMTALAVGKAICANRLRLDTRVDSLITNLSGTDLGAATLRDTLLMASGTTEPTPPDYMGVTVQELQQHTEGTGSVAALIATPRMSSAQRAFFRKRLPGERFSYKAGDPWTAALMVERAVGMPVTRWLEEQVLEAIRAEHPAVLGTDRSGYFQGANGSVRLALIDWIRLAIFVEQQRREDTCYGRFIRDMGTRQISASGTQAFMNGYGYFTWTDNELAPNTFWASGFGGQLIGWSTNPANRRVFMIFSNAANRMVDQIYPLARDWMALGVSR